MPVDDGSGCDQDERLFPSSPDLPPADPEQLVRRRQSPTRPLGVESQELLTKSKVDIRHTRCRISDLELHCIAGSELIC